MGGAIIFLLTLILVAQMARTAGKRKAMRVKMDERLVDEAFGEEEERRQAWIQHYLSEGNFAEARSLGWSGDENLPEWRKLEVQQEAAHQAAIPQMPNLDDML